MPVNQVNKWLWVSGVPSQGDLVGLAAQGVTLDLNTTPLPDTGVPSGMRQVTLGWLDDGKAKPVKDFKKALKAINGKGKKSKGKYKGAPKAGVLAHCQGGVNRGPMLATVLLAVCKGWSAKRAWKKVLNAKPGATAWTVPAYKKSIQRAVKVLGKKKKSARRQPATNAPAMANGRVYA